jgi:hypothetical protein
VFLPDHDDLRHQALQLAHSTGREGVQKTLHRLRSDFYIPGDRALVKDWVRTCTTCQRNKTETRPPAGLLQPLEVPPRCGRTLPSTSSKVCQRWQASR